MKVIFTSLISITFGLSVFAQQDTVANGDFEAWGTNPFYDEADSWTTLNPLAQIFGAELAYQTTDADEVHSGSHSIKLVTTNLSGVGVTPSILTNGTVNTTTQNVEGGAEVSSRPLALDFAYRFDPMGSDSAIASITLTKWDQTNGTILVGSAEIRMGSTNSEWVNEQLVVDYASQETPDTALILFTTGDDVNPQAGTSLFVDDVAYAYSLANIAEAEDLGVIIYPNPADDVLRISTSGSFQPSTINVYSVDGRFVVTTAVNNTVDVSKLGRGVYVLEIFGKDGKVAQQRFVKN